MKILLICAQGMSTSLLVEAMYQVADEGDMIEAVCSDILKQVVDQYDIILLGPQIRYKFQEIKSLCEAKGKCVALVDMRAYGQMDGKKVYQQAKEMAEVSKSKNCNKLL